MLKDQFGNPITVYGINQDITNRKLAELKLKESEAKLTDAMKIAKLSTWEYDCVLDRFTFPDQSFSLINTTAEHEGGNIMSSEQFAQKYIYPDDRVLIEKEIRKAFETPDPAYTSYMEYRVIYAPGEIGTFAANVRIEKDADNRTIKALGVNQDITERKQIEEALRKNELQFRMVWENATDGMRITNETGVVLKANNAYCKMMGKTSEEIEGKMISVVYEQAAQSEILRKHNERFRSQSIPQNLNRDVLLWNGVKISLELSNTFLDIPGQQTLSLSVFRDVTERKQADIALRESEKKYREFADFLPQPVFEFDNRGVFTFANRACFEATGYKPDDIEKGLNVFNLIDPLQHHTLIEAIKNGFNNNQSEGTEYNIVRKDGTSFPSIAYSSPIETEGKLTGLRGMIIDITDRKKAEAEIKISEKKFRNIVEGTKAILFSTNQRGIFTYLNEAACEKLGMKMQDILGKFYLKFIYPENRLKTHSVFTEQLANPKPNTSTDVQIITKSGNKGWLNLLINPIYKEGKVVGLTSVALDITDRKQAEEGMKVSNEQLLN